MPCTSYLYIAVSNSAWTNKVLKGYKIKLCKKLCTIQSVHTFIATRTTTTKLLFMFDVQIPLHVPKTNDFLKKIFFFFSKKFKTCKLFVYSHLNEFAAVQFDMSFKNISHSSLVANTVKRSIYGGGGGGGEVALWKVP